VLERIEENNFKVIQVTIGDKVYPGDSYRNEAYYDGTTDVIIVAELEGVDYPEDKLKITFSKDNIKIEAEIESCNLN